MKYNQRIVANEKDPLKGELCLEKYSKKCCHSYYYL